MASRRTTSKKSSGKRGKGKTKAQLRVLLKKAHNEAEKLLKADKSGRLTRGKLKLGLSRLIKDLDGMYPFEDGHG